jgi:hypothetical protein
LAELGCVSFRHFPFPMHLDVTHDQIFQFMIYHSFY